MAFLTVAGQELSFLLSINSRAKYYSYSLFQEKDVMSLGTILVIVLILVLLGVIPTWPHSTSWGYGPSGIVGTILVILLILVLLGRI
jgi:hypothetical protein